MVINNKVLKFACNVSSVVLLSLLLSSAEAIAGGNIYINNANTTAILCKRVKGKVYIRGGRNNITYYASPEDEDNLDVDIENAENQLLVLPANCLSSNVPYVDMKNGDRLVNPTYKKRRE
jgi:hypothetical protein